MGTGVSEGIGVKRTGRVGIGTIDMSDQGRIGTASTERGVGTTIKIGVAGTLGIGGTSEWIVLFKTCVLIIVMIDEEKRNDLEVRQRDVWCRRICMHIVAQLQSLCTGFADGCVQCAVEEFLAVTRDCSVMTVILMTSS
jgi:hypothetical protein